MKRALLLILTYIACAVTASAQLLGLRNFPTIDVGSGKQNWDIDQDEAGRMLFANNNGLLIFDGVRWATYAVSNNTIVRSVRYDRKRKVIFAGASDEFGYFKYSDASRRLEYHSLSALMKYPRSHNFGEVWNISLKGDKVVFRTKTRTFTFGADLRRADVSPTVDDWQRLPGAELLRGETVRASVQVGRMHVIATASGKLFSDHGGRLTPFTVSISPYLEANEIFCAASRGTTIAFGTVRGGMAAIDLKTGETYYANTMRNLQDNTVLSIAFDSTGNLWLGLDNGVAYIMPNAPFRTLYDNPQSGIGTGYASLQQGQRLYLGTNQGLFVTQWPLRQTPTLAERYNVSGISGQVWELRNNDGIITCATDKGGYVINGGSSTKIEGLDGTWTIVALRRHPGFAIASDYRGFAILRREGDTYRLYGRVKGYNQSSGNVVEDADGTLWVSNWQKGIGHFKLSNDLKQATLLERYDDRNGLPANTNNNVTKIDGRVYISAANGLYRYNRTKRCLQRDARLSGLFNAKGAVMKIDQAANGDLWASCSNFLAIARKQRNGTWATDTIGYSTLGRQLQVGLGAAGMIGPDAAIFNCNRGFMLINPAQKWSKKNNPLFISNITSINDNREESIYNYSYETGTPGVTIPHSRNNIVIRYGMPEYRDEEYVTYSVYMEHYDKGWSTETTATSKEYKLGRGKYIFHVRARNLVTGNVEEKAIEIRILPAWYESWWALLIYIALIGTIVRFSTVRMKARAEMELRRVKDENDRKLTKIKNEQLETELKHRYSELADQTMNLVHKNDILQQIDTSLDKLSESVRREDAKAKITAAISEIRHSLQESLNDDGNWDKFEENFNLVYDNYMKKLRELYPTLNRTDLKLCAYLRMGLSSKEMVSLLNISVRSIETARYRLRKKLCLNAGENLTDFIQNIDKMEK